MNLLKVLLTEEPSKMNNLDWREMAQGLKALPALPHYLGLIPSTW